MSATRTFAIVGAGCVMCGCALLTIVRVSRPLVVGAFDSMARKIQPLSAPEPDVGSTSVTSSSVAMAVSVAPEDCGTGVRRLSGFDLASVMGASLVRDWVEQDPAAAASWALQNADPTLRASLLQAVAVYWTRQNFAEAIA